MEAYQPRYHRRYALIVAIDEYNQSLRALENAVRGARALEDLLRTTYGFETRVLINHQATRQSLMQSLAYFKEQCEPDDCFLFYFAGHGHTERSLRTGKVQGGYLALAETNPKHLETAFSLAELREQLRSIEAKHILALLDSCFSGTMLTQPRSGQEEFSGRKLVEVFLTQPFRYAITAGGDERTDDNAGPDPSYSLFSYYLLEGLRGNARENKAVAGARQIVRSKQLATYIETHVAASRATQHKPQHGFLGEIEGGDFLFIADASPGVVTVESTCVVHDPKNVVEASSLSAMQRLQRTAELTVMEEITSGMSGSRVYLVNITGRSGSGLGGLHYCKIYMTPFGNEQRNFELLDQTPISQHMPRLVDHSIAVDKWTASVYTVAKNAVGRSAKSLADLLEANDLAAADAITKLVALLRLWNPPKNKPQVTSPLELLLLPFTQFAAGSSLPLENKLVERISDIVPGLTSEDSLLVYAGHDRVLPNPVPYVSSPELWRGAPLLSWPSGHSHGDLHTNNVICLTNRGANAIDGEPALIDFDTYQPNGCVLYDLAYLEVDIAMRVADPSQESTRAYWPEVSDSLAHSILLDQVSSLPRFRLLRDFLPPIRAAVDSICQQQPPDFETAYWLMRASAGLNIARKRKPSSAQRKLGLLLAAHSLRAALNHSRDGFAVDRQPLFVPWQTASGSRGESASPTPAAEPAATQPAATQPAATQPAATQPASAQQSTDAAQRPQAPAAATADDKLLPELPATEKQPDSLFDCDIELVEEIYPRLPQAAGNPEQGWFFGAIHRIDRINWTIPVFEKRSDGGKRQIGEISVSATLAGLKIDLDKRGISSASAGAAYDLLRQELSLALGQQDAVPQVSLPSPPDKHTGESTQAGNLHTELTARRIQALCNILESAFTENELSQLVYYCFGKRLDSVVGGNNLSEKVFQLVYWTQRTDTTDLLLQAAIKANPTNRALKDFYASLD